MVDLTKIRDSVIDGEADEVRDMVKKAVDEGQEVGRILNEALLLGTSIVGDKYEKGEFFLPEMFLGATAMKEGLKVLTPLLAQSDSDIKAAGTVIMGTAEGDIHDIGKTIVSIMLEASGFMVTDIGVDLAPDKFVEAAKENNADLIGVSAMLTTTMMGMKDIIEAVKEAGLKAKVMIGGSSVTQEFADEIGADGYALDASSAVKKAKELMKG